MAVTETREANVIKYALGAGDTSNPLLPGGRDVVATCKPGGGGTMKVQASWSTVADVNSGAATWFDWDLGTVSGNATRLISKPTGIRFTATTAAGTGEVVL